jgi:hypothetical protein
MFDCSGVKVPVHGLMEWTGIAQIHLAIRPRRAVLPEPIEAGPVAPAQFHHSFDCQSRPAFTSSRTFGRPRISRQCLQHPLFLDAQ